MASWFFPEPLRLALAGLALSSLLLAGCSGRSVDGIWINQAAIDAAVADDSLREALLAYGPNLEWRVQAARGLARFSNGFEQGEGRLQALAEGGWQVDFGLDEHEQLRRSGAELLQGEGPSWPAQRFRRYAASVDDSPLGSHFEAALYRAYLGGSWLITQGLGERGLVLFHADGRVEGLPGAERYALCLAGDCAAMAGEHDSLWLQQGAQGQTWLFRREGGQLRIFQAINQSAADEMPSYQPGAEVWRLQRD